MSFIIKGIDLPETKDERYIIQVYKSGDVYIGKETWDGTKKGRDRIVQAYLGEYQAIQIPTPHGRLIDGGFEEMHYTSMTTNPTPDVTEQDKANSVAIVRALQMAHTILEAEE